MPFAEVLCWPKLGDALGFAGLILLALPAVWMAKAGFRASKLGATPLGNKVGAEFHLWKGDLFAKLLAKAQTWSALHTWCLFLGYAFFVASYLVTLFVTCSG